MRHYPGGMLNDGRPKRRFGRMGLVALVGSVAIVGFVLSTSDDGETVRPTKRIERLDDPTWHDSELNRPTLPGSRKEVVDLEVTENNDDPLHILGTVRRNQTIFVALRSRGLLPDRIQPVVDAMSTVFNFRRSRPGDRYEVRLDLDGNVLEFRYQTSPEDIFVANLVGDQHVAERVDVPKEVVLARVSGAVTSSLFQTFRALGEQDEAARRFMDLFAYDFDFGNDAQMGDRFGVLAEKVYLNGEFYKYGRLQAANYISGGKTYAAYYFDASPNDDAAGEYYDADGYALRRMFLKTPVHNVKMTSPFNRKRLHPILKRVRPHLGIDYAGPTGTPVMAFADGVVSFAGWKGGNGNLVTIEHANGYESVYAHLHHFPRHIKKGKEVKQQEVIGYVGSTGLSTAPHLHFGVKKGGHYIDPQSIDTSRGEKLRGVRLSRFQKERDRLQAVLDGNEPLPSATPLEPAAPAPDAP